MAIITEEEDEQQEPKSQSQPKPKKPQQNPTSSSTKTKPQMPSSSSSSLSNPFAFWFYFVLTVSVIALIFISFNTLSPQDPKSWFLSLPLALRQHYSKGRTIKVQTHQDQSPFEVFTFEQGRSVSENVVIVHGLGLSSYSFKEIVGSLGVKGIHAVAIDLPGHGFSDKLVLEAGGASTGVLGRFWNVYSEIQEKGLFWAFDQIIETGEMPYEEIQARVSKRKVWKPIEFGSEQIGKVLGQVIETTGLSPVHLVVHDTALVMTANWILENSKSLRSLTLIDTKPTSLPALPLWALDVPVIREVVLGSSIAYAWLVKKCCSRGIGALDLDSHRVLLKSRNSRRSVVGMGKKLNHSFDVGEWGGSDELKHLPIQVLWSKSWSKSWSKEGDRVAEALPQASFVAHSGGRWPQDSIAEEIAQSIFQFVSSLPATDRKIEEEPIPEHIQRMLDEAKNNPHHDHHHHHHHHGVGGHDHDGHTHEAGFMDAYGIGHGHGHGW